MQGNNINRGTINKITTCPNRNWTHPPSSHSITLLSLLYIIDAASTDKSSVACFSSFPHSLSRSSSPGYHSGQTHLLEWLLSEAFARYDRDKLTNRTWTGEGEGQRRWWYDKRSEVKSSKEYFKLDLCVPFITLRSIYIETPSTTQFPPTQ